MSSNRPTARRLYRKLLSLYPPGFREQLGESMEQTFNDRCNERKRTTDHGWFGFLLGIFLETSSGIFKEYLSLVIQRGTMKNMLTSPTGSAIISFLLFLPVTILFLLLIFNIEPPLGPLKPLVTAPPDQPDVVGSLIALGLFLLLPVAFLTNLAPIVRSLRAGNGLMGYPINLFVAVAILTVFGMIIASLIIDQYPCWIGVPNCD
jgi:hypothetical protein